MTWRQAIGHFLPRGLGARLFPSQRQGYALYSPSGWVERLQGRLLFRLLFIPAAVGTSSRSGYFNGGKKGFTGTRKIGSFNAGAGSAFAGTMGTCWNY
jgi:hypothetical protein